MIGVDTHLKNKDYTIRKILMIMLKERCKIIYTLCSDIKAWYIWKRRDGHTHNLFPHKTMISLTVMTISYSSVPKPCLEAEC